MDRLLVHSSFRHRLLETLVETYVSIVHLSNYLAEKSVNRAVIVYKDKIRFISAIIFFESTSECEELQ